MPCCDVDVRSATIVAAIQNGSFAGYLRVIILAFGIKVIDTPHNQRTQPATVSACITRDFHLLGARSRDVSQETSTVNCVARRVARHALAYQSRNARGLRPISKRRYLTLGSRVSSTWQRLKHRCNLYLLILCFQCRCTSTCICFQMN